MSSELDLANTSPAASAPATESRLVNGLVGPFDLLSRAGAFANMIDFFFLSEIVTMIR
jgi:hypothetical protein